MSRHLGRARVQIGAIVLAVLVVTGAAGAAAGDLDPRFGNGGIVVTDFGSVDSAEGVALQPNGAIVVAGFGGSGRDIAVARYTRGGTLDRSFGRHGKVRTDLGGDDAAADVAVQADGRILVAGRTAAGADAADFALVRYQPNGTLDPGFGRDGIVRTDFGGLDAARAVAIQPDGKIVAAGYAVLGVTTTADFALARYTVDGNLDLSFGSGGKVLTSFRHRAGVDDIGEDVAIQTDGKIVVAGFSRAGGDYDFALARYTLDVRLDPSFGDGGEVLTNIETTEGASALALQADGKIVAAGVAVILNPIFALVRLLSDGSLDRSFGNGFGYVVTSFGGIGCSYGWARAVDVQADGKIVAFGESYSETCQGFAFALGRYRTDGSLDPTFGRNGKVMTNIRVEAGGRALAIQQDGKIVGAGVSDRDFALARYLQR